MKTFESFINEKFDIFINSLMVPYEYRETLAKKIKNLFDLSVKNITNEEEKQKKIEEINDLIQSSKDFNDLKKKNIDGMDDIIRYITIANMYISQMYFTGELPGDRKTGVKSFDEQEHYLEIGNIKSVSSLITDDMYDEDFI